MLESPSAPPVEAARFTLDGSVELETQLQRICDAACRGVQRLVPGPRLEALLLGGGYGRGEGGVRRTPQGDAPYNDIEIYVCLTGHPRWNERVYGEGLHHLAEELTTQAGIEVEFKIISLARLRRAPATMFSYDLVMGHRWLVGYESLLADAPQHTAAANIPLGEATRLLMNRGSGLLFARERLAQEMLTPDDADFIGRNLAKAQLALGDAVLVTRGKYHWSCRERTQRLAELTGGGELPWLDAVRRHHGEGARFKLHPTSVAPEEHAALRERVQDLTALMGRVWLWLEGRRLGRTFASAYDYALSPVNKCPETPAWRNLIVNLRTFGFAALFDPQGLRYPRERLFHALALLLWQPGALGDRAFLHRVQRQLRTRETTVAKLGSAYEALWRGFR